VSERGLTLSIGVAPALPRIRTDQTHLRQILINLIGNAVKYTPSGSIHVLVRIVTDGAGPAPQDADARDVGLPPDPARSWVALQVKDSGVGIAPADQERIFDEFEQVNAGARTDSARRGTGLGLAISRRLSRLLGGDLTVVSEPGRGSTFTVWLPLGENEPT
jgi:signal transduction histidine kinase